MSSSVQQETAIPFPVVTRALQWSGNPYGNEYGVEMEWKWGIICENRMDWIGFGAECRLKTI